MHMTISAEAVAKWQTGKINDRRAETTKNDSRTESRPNLIKPAAVISFWYEQLPEGLAGFPGR